jgi:hypothetical protein
MQKVEGSNPFSRLPPRKSLHRVKSISARLRRRGSRAGIERSQPIADNKLARMNVSEADHTNQGTRFENHVARLLDMLGFSVERNVLMNGRQIDLVATDGRGPISSRYIVECKDQTHNVTTAEFDSFQAKVQGGRNNGDPRLGGIFVTTTGFVKEAKAQAHSLGVDLIHIADLERSLVDLTPLVSAQLNELREDQGVAEFVEPTLRLDGRTEARPAIAAIREWLYNRHKNQLTLLGDFGVGKTTLLKRLAVELGETFLESGSGTQGTPAPIYVDLRQDGEAGSLPETIFGLFRRYGASPFSYELFWQFCREGRVLILLDGFDELASRTDADVTIENFREINRSVIGRSKLILTCRTHYFLDDAQVHDFHGEHERASDPVYSELYQEIAGRPNFEIRHLEDFDPEQITRFIRNRLGEDAEEDVWRLLTEHYNLVDLARRPVLLDMILDSLDRIREEAGEVTSALLYEVYTNIWLQRNDWKTSVDPEVREVLIEELALQMTIDSRSRLSHSEFPSLIRRARPDLDKVGIEECDRELRRAGFLIRDSSGAYRFAHKSFQEFFFAKRLVRRLRAGEPPEPLPLKELRRRITTEVFRFVCDMVRRDESAAIGGARLIEAQATEDPTLWLVIKFVSRSEHPRVLDALKGFIADRKLPMKSRGDSRSRHSLPFAVAVTALGWLDRRADPGVHLELLRDERQPYTVRHNALIALSRSERPEAMEAVCEFVVDCDPLAAYNLFSTRVMLGLVSAGLAAPAVDAVLERWTRDRDFAGEWRFADDLTALCTLCAHSRQPTASEILRHVARTARFPRVVAAALLAMDDGIVAEVEETVLDKARNDEGWGRYGHHVQLAMAVARFESPRATDLLVEMLFARDESVVEVALRALCARAPDRARDAVYGGPDPWAGKHWSTPQKLVAAELLQDLYPDDVVRDVRRLLKHKRLPGPDAFAALRILAKIAPEGFRGTVERVLSSGHPPAVVAYACELLYEVNEATGREVALELGLSSASPARVIRIIELLRSDTASPVTGALVKMFPDEMNPRVRAELARGLISPGRSVPRTELEQLIAAEGDGEIRQILELGLHGDAKALGN